MTGFKKKKRYGTFTSNKDKDTLKKAQKQRLLYMYLSTLTLALFLFLPQEWAEKSKDITALQTAYVLLVIALVVVSVMASYGAGKSCNITGTVSEKHRPKAGFEKATFASQEWFMYLHYVLAAWEIALLIYGFGIWGLIGTLLSAGGAALATLSRIVTFRAFKDELSYTPPEEPAPEQKAEEEKAETENSDTEAKE